MAELMAALRDSQMAEKSVEKLADYWVVLMAVGSATEKAEPLVVLRAGY